jgi:hypothetical protein
MARHLQGIAAAGRASKRAETRKIFVQILAIMRYVTRAEGSTRLSHIETAPTQLEQTYQGWRTLQVPEGRVIAVMKRVRRQTGSYGTFLSFARA